MVLDIEMNKYGGMMIVASRNVADGIMELSRMIKNIVVGEEIRAGDYFVVAYRQMKRDVVALYHDLRFGDGRVWGEGVDVDEEFDKIVELIGRDALLKGQDGILEEIRGRLVEPIELEPVVGKCEKVVKMVKSRQMHSTLVNELKLDDYRFSVDEYGDRGKKYPHLTKPSSGATIGSVMHEILEKCILLDVLYCVEGNVHVYVYIVKINGVDCGIVYIDGEIGGWSVIDVDYFMMFSNLFNRVYADDYGCLFDVKYEIVDRFDDIDERMRVLDVEMEEVFGKYIVYSKVEANDGCGGEFMPILIPREYGGFVNKEKFSEEDLEKIGLLSWMDVVRRYNFNLVNAYVVNCVFRFDILIENIVYNVLYVYGEDGKIPIILHNLRVDSEGQNRNYESYAKKFSIPYLNYTDMVINNVNLIFSDYMVYIFDGNTKET